MRVVKVGFTASPPGMPELDEYTMERVLEEFEQRCYDNMNHAIETEEGLGIEYDEDVVCDVCQSPDGEDGNEMVFCDKCNICVHQVGGSGREDSGGAWTRLASPQLGPVPVWHGQRCDCRVDTLLALQVRWT